MKSTYQNYVIRLSASGVLCLSALGCGLDEASESAVKFEADSLKKSGDTSPQDCDIDLQKYLKDLQDQGRLTDCDVEVQDIDMAGACKPDM